MSLSNMMFLCYIMLPMQNSNDDLNPLLIIKRYKIFDFRHEPHNCRIGQPLSL